MLVQTFSVNTLHKDIPCVESIVRNRGHVTATPVTPAYLREFHDFCKKCKLWQGCEMNVEHSGQYFFFLVEVGGIMNYVCMHPLHIILLNYKRKCRFPKRLNYAGNVLAAYVLPVIAHHVRPM